MSKIIEVTKPILKHRLAQAVSEEEFWRLEFDQHNDPLALHHLIARQTLVRCLAGELEAALKQKS